FQAEDGIRDRNVTGVQTCALPIYSVSPVAPVRSRTTRPLAGSGAHRARAPRSRPGATASGPPRHGGPGRPAPAVADGPPDGGREIGRAACREGRDGCGAAR